MLESWWTYYRGPRFDYYGKLGRVRLRRVYIYIYAYTVNYVLYDLGYHIYVGIGLLQLI